MIVERVMNFNEERIQKIKEIEQLLLVYLPPKENYQKIIMEAMDYSLMGGGKRLRPMLMAEVFKMFGGTSNVVEPFMAAIEMIHTYSLVHDDLPAMDNDEYRRGRKTTHIVYGEDIGILTGDALLNYAFEVSAKAFEIDPDHALRIGKAIQILGKKSGIYGMIGGQVVDVKSTGNKITPEVLDFIFKLKTSALIESAMMTGAILAGAKSEEVDIIEKIAGYVGMAFQIQDDILDITSTTQVLGKPVHSDEKNEKTTYVTLHGMEKSKKDVMEYSTKAIGLLAELDVKNLYLEWLLKELISRDK